MSDLIKKSNVSIPLAQYISSNAYLNQTALDALLMVLHWVVETPTVDAEPVVHARWEYIEDYAYSRIGWYCTSCRKRIPNEMVAFAKRCHHCGAKMDAPRGDDDA